MGPMMHQVLERQSEVRMSLADYSRHAELQDRALRSLRHLSDEDLVELCKLSRKMVRRYAHLRALYLQLGEIEIRHRESHHKALRAHRAAEAEWQSRVQLLQDRMKLLRSYLSRGGV